MSEPRKIVITLERWLCSKEHKHTSEANAVKCDLPKKPKKRLKSDPPAGYLRADAACDLVRNAELVCNTIVLGELVEKGIISGRRAYLPAGPYWLNEAELLALIKTLQGGDPGALYPMVGRRPIVECEACGYWYGRVTHGKPFRHRCIPKRASPESE